MTTTTTTTTRSRRWIALAILVAGASLVGGTALAATSAPEAVAGSGSRAVPAAQADPAAVARLIELDRQDRKQPEVVSDRMVIPALGDQGFKVVTFGKDLPAGEYRIEGGVTVMPVPTSSTVFAVRKTRDGSVHAIDGIDRAFSFDTSEYFFSNGDQVRVYARNGATLSKIADLANDN